MDNILSKSWFWILFVCIIIAGGIFYSGYQSERVDDDQLAIRINETEYTRGKFEDTLTQVRNEFLMYGMELSEEELKEEAINRLIQETFVVEYAEKYQIEVSPSEVDAEIDNLLIYAEADSIDQLLEELKGIGIESEEQLRNDISSQIKISKIFQHFMDDVEISDSDLLLTYNLYKDDATERGEDFPEYEEVEDYISSELKEEEVNVAIMEKLNQYMEDAKVEILIDFELPEEDKPEQLEDLLEEEVEMELETDEAELEEIEVELEQ